MILIFEPVVKGSDGAGSTIPDPYEDGQVSKARYTQVRYARKECIDVVRVHDVGQQQENGEV